ncbi:hypothetical protein [Streptomyces omiyaensis]
MSRTTQARAWGNGDTGWGYGDVGWGATSDPEWGVHGGTAFLIIGR